MINAAALLAILFLAQAEEPAQAKTLPGLKLRQVSFTGSDDGSLVSKPTTPPRLDQARPLTGEANPQAQSTQSSSTNQSSQPELRALKERVEQLERSLKEKPVSASSKEASADPKSSQPAGATSKSSSPPKSDSKSTDAKSSGNDTAKKSDDKSKEKTSESKDSAGKDASDKLKELEKENKWTVKLGGHVQLDYLNWARNPPQITEAKDFFEFRRLRLTADGTGYGVYDFRLQMTLEPETIGESAVGTVTSPDVKDAYFSINEVPLFGRLRVGNFFVPFSLEQVTNDTNNIFLERSIPSQGIFSPDREVGIAMYQASDDHRLTFSSGVFFDSISEGLKERIDDNQGYRASGRLTWLPFYDESSNGRYLWHLGTGIMFTEDQDGRVRLRARPHIHEGPRLIDTGSLQATSYTNVNLEHAVVWGAFAWQSEAFVSQVNQTFAEREYAFGAYAHVSYFLTGENRIFEKFGQHGAQFGRAKPNNTVRFHRCESCWGGWEFKARYSYLNLNSFSAGNYHDVTVGFNWYWSDRVRIMFDWIHPVTTSPAVFGSTNSDLLGIRFDFNW